MQLQDFLQFDYAIQITQPVTSQHSKEVRVQNKNPSGAFQCFMES